MSLFTILLCLAAGTAASLVGGALSGIRIGGEDLGNELAAYMGGLYGLLAGVAAVIVGLVAVSLI